MIVTRRPDPETLDVFEPTLRLELDYEIFKTLSSSVIWSQLYVLYSVYSKIISLLPCLNLKLEFLEKTPWWILCVLVKCNDVFLHVELGVDWLWNIMKCGL